MRLLKVPLTEAGSSYPKLEQGLPRFGTDSNPTPWPRSYSTDRHSKRERDTRTLGWAFCDPRNLFSRDPNPLDDPECPPLTPPGRRPIPLLPESRTARRLSGEVGAT